MKKFAELKTDKAKQARLDKYAKEREARGTQEQLCRLVAKPIVKETSDGNYSVALRLWLRYNKETKKNEYQWANAYVLKSQEALLGFYKGLKPGTVLAVEYFMKNGFMNIYSAFERSTKKAKVEAK